MNSSQEEHVDTRGTMYPENAAPEKVPTAEEIQALADRLEVPTDVPGQLRSLATDLDHLSKALEFGISGPAAMAAAAELQRMIAECLRMVALRVPREEGS